MRASPLAAACALALAAAACGPPTPAPAPPPEPPSHPTDPTNSMKGGDQAPPSASATTPNDPH